MPKIQATRGTDIKTVLVYTDDAGAPIDLTNATYRVFDAQDYLLSKIKFTDKAPTSGTVNMLVEWGDDIPDHTNIRAGSSAELPSFRVQMTIGTDDIGSEQIVLEYI